MTHPALVASAGAYPAETPDPTSFPESLVASSASPEYASPTVDVGGMPTHVPAKRLSAQLTRHEHHVASSTERSSPVKWDDLVAFLSNEKVGRVTFQATARRGAEAALYAEPKNQDAIIVVEVRYGDLYTVTIAAETHALVHKYETAVLTFLSEYPPPPPPPPLPYNRVPVAFWMQNPNTGGAASRWRTITVQGWKDVRDNYPGELSTELDALMALDEPSGGKILLMHGPPGNGKTRAILTLISEWRDWCDASVVTDADRLLSDPTYLNDIVFNMEGSGWLLLVIEDGDEFLNVDGRESKGQAIARLLNIGDGIVGQGIKLLTLISTNVAMDKLNPAVARPGRCMANVHFGGFSPEDATAWLAAKGFPDQEFNGTTSLAFLYAKLAELNGGPVAETVTEGPAELDAVAAEHEA